jgi:transposase
MVELVAVERNPEALSKDFKVGGQKIPKWLRQVRVDAGTPKDGLTSAKREGLTRLRRENWRVKMEQEILADGGLADRPVRHPPCAAFPPARFTHLRLETPFRSGSCVNHDAVTPQLDEPVGREGVLQDLDVILQQTLQRSVAHVPRRDEQQARRSPRQQVCADEIRVLGDHDPVVPASQINDVCVERAISIRQIQCVQYVVPARGQPACQAAR